jgi:hypothetical protein
MDIAKAIENVDDLPKVKSVGLKLAELLPDLPVQLRIERIQDHSRRNHFEHLASVHLSDTPTRSAKSAKDGDLNSLIVTDDIGKA